MAKRKGFVVISYKNNKSTRFFLLVVIIFVVTSQLHARYIGSENLDVMIDFAYPVLPAQQLRHNLSQALYFSQQDDYAAAADRLQQALSQFNFRQAISQEDREYIENMIQQIDALIQSLEQTDKSIIMLDLCHQINEQL